MSKDTNQKYIELKEDYDYLLKIIKQKNEEIDNLELLVSNLLDKIESYKNKIK